MNSRSAACSVPQPLAPVGLGALGAQLCLPPREEALRGFVRPSGLQSKTGSVEDGQRWDGCRCPCPGVWKGFQRWLQVGDTFCALSWGPDPSGQHWELLSAELPDSVSTPYKAGEICHIILCVSARNSHMFPWQVQVPDTAQANFLLAGSLRVHHGTARTGMDPCLSSATGADCPCWGPLPVPQVTPSTQPGVLTAGLGWLEEERGWLQVKCKGGRGNDWTWSILAAPGSCYSWCLQKDVRDFVPRCLAVLLCLLCPAQTTEAFRSELWRTPALLISKSLKYCK